MMSCKESKKRKSFASTLKYMTDIVNKAKKAIGQAKIDDVYDYTYFINFYDNIIREMERKKQNQEQNRN